MGIQGTRALRSLREACATSDSTNPSSAALPAASRRCWLAPDVARSNPRGARRWLAAMLLGAGSLLVAASQDAAAFATDACLVARGGTGCTANDGSISNVALNNLDPAPNTNPPSCNAGDQIDVDLLITLGAINANSRNDIGIYIAKDGNPITNVAGQATTCNVFTTPVPAGPPPSTGTFPPESGTFSNLDGNACGDLQKAFGQGTPTNPAWVVKSGKISVKCVAGPGGLLAIPGGLSYRQNAGTCNTPAADLSPGTTSKCIAGTTTVPITVTLPAGSVGVTKEWVNAPNGDTATMSISGPGVTQALGGDSTAPSTTNNATALATPGTTVTVTEALGGGNKQTNYTTTLACDNNGQPVQVVNGSFTMPPAGGVGCTFTNTGTVAAVTLSKIWVGAVAGDTTTLSITGDQVSGGNGGIGNSTAPNTTTAATANAVTGTTVSLAETLGVGNVGTYTSSVECTANGSPISVTSNTITMPNAAVICTFTNTAVTNAVTVVKQLVGFNDPGLFNLLVNGTAVASNVGGGGQGTSVPISAGSTVTVTETAGTGTSLGNYTPLLGCVSGATPVPVTNGQFAMPAAGVTCTFTNTRLTNLVTLTKSWVSAVSGDTTTLDIFGDQVTSAVQGNSTAPSTTTAATATASVGSTVSLAETLGVGNAGTYISSVACTDSGGPITVTSNTITMPNAPVTCTFTNGSPTINKAFSPLSISVGGTTVLTFTVTNPAGNPALSNVGWVDTLPSGLQVANTTVGGTCTNAAAATTVAAAGSSITVANLQVPAGASTCTVTVNVTNEPQQSNASCTPLPAAFTNGSGNVTVSNVTNAVTDSCVTVLPLSPSMNKAFSPLSINVGGTTVLTFTVSNPAGNPALSNVGWVDTLPSGLQVANTTVGGTCTNAAAATTVAAAGSSITVANLQVPAGASTCTVTVNVTNAPQQSNASCTSLPAAFTNGSGNVTVSNVTNAVTDSCVTVLPLSPSMNKAFSPPSINVGGTTVLTFTVTNPAGNPALSNVGWVDTLPSGLQVANTTVGGTCTNAAAATTVAAAGSSITVANLQVPAGASTCTVTVNVTNKPQQSNASCTPAPAAFTNGSGNVTVSNVTNAVTDSCVTVLPLSPSMNKAFSPLSISVGGTTVLTFTVTNPAGNPALSNVGWVDTLPSGLQVANTTVGGSCANAAAATAVAAAGSSITVTNLQVPAGASTCTVTVNVTNKPQQSNASCTPAPAAFTNGSGNVTVSNVTNAVTDSCVTVLPLLPSMNKAFSPPSISVGGTTVLTFTVTNPAGNPALSNVGWVDTLPSGLQVANTTVGGSCANAAAATTVAAAGSSITVANLQVPAGASTCTVTVNVTNKPQQSNASCTPAPAAFTNGSGNVTVSNVTNAVTDSCVTVLPLSPSMNKAFSPPSINVGGTTVLTLQ